MAKSKKIRTRGKIKLSDYFKNLVAGDKVGVVRDLGIRASFPDRLMGCTGTVLETRGAYKLIEIKEGNKKRTFIIHPVHLKKLK